MTKPDDILGRDYDRALEQAQSQDASSAQEILEQELFMREQPVLAERQGVTKQLISAGLHEPAGSTVSPSGDFDGAAAAKPSTKRFDPRDKRDAGLQGHEGYVIISGSFTKVKELLKGFAEERDLPTIIGAERDREIGLTVALSKNEIAHLARWNATYLGSNKRPVPLNGTAAPGLEA